MFVTCSLLSFLVGTSLECALYHTVAAACCMLLCLKCEGEAHRLMSRVSQIGSKALNMFPACGTSSFSGVCSRRRMPNPSEQSAPDLMVFEFFSIERSKYYWYTVTASWSSVAVPHSIEWCIRGQYHCFVGVAPTRSSRSPGSGLKQRFACCYDAD